jgi:hypothetical protein
METKIVEIVNPRETALKTFLGASQYRKLERKARKEGQPSPYAYWRDNGGFTYEI